MKRKDGEKMIYVTSDIHGNYKRYQALLAKINLTKKDALIILGDIVDRGKQSMEILLDAMQRENIFVILGNHEQLALMWLTKLNQTITNESIDQFSTELMEILEEWLFHLGGQATLDSFMRLSPKERTAVLDYLDELPVYETFEINHQKYLLVHGGLENFNNDKAIDDYSEDELIWCRPDYRSPYFEDAIVIAGHTPTRTILENPRPDYIFKANNHIDIDCGCGYPDGQLGCICLNTMEEFYIR